MNLRIGPVRENEFYELEALLQELSGKPSHCQKMAENFSWMLENPDYIVLGANFEGRLVGTLMGIICRDLVGECQPFMVIENVIVSERFRGLGIGKRLMREIEAIGRNRNCLYIMFVSGMHRKDAHRFYASLGYDLQEVQGFKKYLQAHQD